MSAITGVPSDYKIPSSPIIAYHRLSSLIIAHPRLSPPQQS
ncbi:hypothetical protein [Prevotella denticola]|nr:hypothetical protein [Prevotella denticola]